MNRRPKIIFFSIIAAIVLIPVWMWVWWLLKPSIPLTIAIVDKTVLLHPAQEHESFNWVLKHLKYVKPDGSFYEVDKDYLGFFPQSNYKYQIKDFDKKARVSLINLAHKTDVAYFTDTYGIYSNEWYTQKANLEYSKKIYGGLSDNDLIFIKELKKEKKLIITEFNTIASPTNGKNRKEFEALFGLEWTGWTGRYFDLLDTALNKELPKWLTRNYKLQHHDNWPFKLSGIVFVSESNQIEILEYGRHLTETLPIIETKKAYRAAYGLPATMKYPFWFDIMRTSHKNDVIATYSIKATPEGNEVLAKAGILNRFPAVTAHDKADYRFYYFSGDFADNPIDTRLSYFEGIRTFSSLFYPHTTSERNSFFWDYYIPLISNILAKPKPIK